MTDKPSTADLPIADKPRRISRRVREVVQLLLSGECKTIKAAAARTNMNPNYLSGVLKKPEIRVFAEHEARKNLTAGTLRASARIIELLDAGSEHVAFDAAKHLLGISGIKPAADPQVAVNIEVKAGYVIDLSEPGDPPRASKIIEHEPTSERSSAQQDERD